MNLIFKIIKKSETHGFVYLRSIRLKNKQWGGAAKSEKNLQDTSLYGLRGRGKKLKIKINYWFLSGFKLYGLSCADFGIFVWLSTYTE